MPDQRSPRPIARGALLLLGLLALLNVPFSVPSLGGDKSFGWSAKPAAAGANEQIVTRTLRRARAAGLLPGDHLLGIDGTSADSAALATAREKATPGDTLDLLIRRGTEQRLVRVPVSESSPSYLGFLSYVVILSLVAWLAGIALIVWRGNRRGALLLAGALLLLPPSFFPSGIPGDHLLATGLRIPWQVAGASYAIFFPALLLHFSAVQGRWPAALRSPIAWLVIYAALAGIFVVSSGNPHDLLGWSHGGTSQHVRAGTAVAICLAVIVVAGRIYHHGKAFSFSIRWLGGAIMLVALTTIGQILLGSYAPWWIGTEAMSEIDSLALLLLPTLTTFHFFVPRTTDGVWDSQRWVNSASWMVVTWVYGLALVGVSGAVLHMTNQRLGGVEWLLFVAIIMTTLALSPVLQRVRELVDRRLLADWIEREGVANIFVERVGRELELERIAANVARELPSVLAVASAELVLAKEAAEEWLGRDASIPMVGVTTMSRAEIGVALAGSHRPNGDDIVIAVRDAENTLVGALRMGRRLDGRDFDTAADGLHRIVSQGVANALASARSYLILRRAREELAESERIASLGVLASGLAHEIKNPLASLQMGLYLLERQGADGSKLSRIRRDVRRIDDIVCGLLRYTNHEPVERPGLVDVRPIVSNCVAELRPLAEDRGARLTERYAHESASVLGLPGQVRLVVSNILTNAIDSIPDGGAIHVELELSTSLVEISVADTGPGIPPELRDRIFQLNFSTKPGGSGIGLALARRETERLGGHIDVESGASIGTSLRIVLPRAYMDTKTVA
ncbi:MAG TPA: ATP-binding protein [Gemmatimonadaceae bacterium]|nr:ATP-binding protein [Gemmatimonadaceae bacterium]